MIVLDDQAQIQDGQQRLATTLLFARAIYDAAEQARQDPQHTVELATNVLGAVTPALRTGTNAALSLSPADQAVLLQRAGIRADSPESTKRLEKVRQAERPNGSLLRDVRVVCRVRHGAAGGLCFLVVAVPRGNP